MNLCVLAWWEERGGDLSWILVGGQAGGVQSGRDADVHVACSVPSREAFTIPLIPLGLKETKDVDFSVALKVNPKAMGTGFAV